MKKLSLVKGEEVMYNRLKCRVIKVHSLSSVTIEEVNSSIRHTVGLTDLSAVNEEVVESRIYDQLSEKEWRNAQYRFNVILPVLKNRGDINIVKKAATDNKVSVPTIYRWVRKFESSGMVSSLANEVRFGGKGQSRLMEAVNDIVEDTIHKVYLNSSRKSIVKTIREIRMKCSDLGLPLPHPNTIRKRINNLRKEDVISSRYGSKESDSKYRLHEGKFPGADHPLSVVQIDHTPVDIILVDEKSRKPLHRPWLTVAIDVYSRMVVGFYISFDTPGALGTGICIANSILPKEDWLVKMGVNGEWPCWGIMQTIHVDNAKEFRGNMLKRACREYGINIDFRPVATPRYGGHVERLLGAFSKEIHDLPGTTFSNPNDRRNYDSAKNASFTLSEFEKWLSVYIVNIYHQSEHSGINCSPIEKWREGILGDNNNPGIGIPDRITDERRTRLDFLPIIDRSIQQYGVVIDHIQYYSDVLRPYVKTQNGKGRNLFTFKRDPRDLSKIYFLDPRSNKYFEIPYRNAIHPRITLAEHRELIKILKDQRKPLSEEALFREFKVLKEIESRAIRQTKKVRRTNGEIPPDKEEKQQKEFDFGIYEREIKPFEDIDDEPFKR